MARFLCLFDFNINEIFFSLSENGFFISAIALHFGCGSTSSASLDTKGVMVLSTEATTEVKSGGELGVEAEVSADLPAAGRNATKFFNVIEDAILEFYEFEY